MLFLLIGDLLFGAFLTKEGETTMLTLLRLFELFVGEKKGTIPGAPPPSDSLRAACTSRFDFCDLFLDLLFDVAVGLEPVVGASHKDCCFLVVDSLF